MAMDTNLTPMSDVAGDDTNGYNIIIDSQTEEPYTIDRCISEGFLYYENEESRKEDANPKLKDDADLVGNTDSTDSAKPNVALMALNTTKCGMEGIDAETINKTIAEASEGSKFYEHKKKQQEKLDKKIAEIKLQEQKLTNEQIEKAQMEVNKLVGSIQGDMDLSRCYVHLDMDAFFASVEMRDNPSLRDLPMAVGSESMLSTSNYVARRYGVRAAMPGFIGRKLCPQLKIIPCNFKKYEEASKVVEKTIKIYDENLYMCMDEADLDITTHVLPDLDGSTGQKCLKDNIAWSLVEEMRKKIEAATNLTASAGIAPTRFLAKLCSDIKKPNGQCALANSQVAIKAFLSTIPIRKVCGIGAVTEQLLKALNIHTCKDLWDKRAILYLLFKRATFQSLLGIAMGTGSNVFRDMGADSDSNGRKSLSCERTFTGTADLGFLQDLCKSLCSEVEKDLKSTGLSTKTITLKIKTTEYDVKTRARSIMERTDSAERIFQAAWKIYMSYIREIPDLTIRLMGVRVSNLEERDADSMKEGYGTLDKFLKSNHPKPSTNSTSSTNGTHQNQTPDCSEEYVYMSCPVCDKSIRAKTIVEAERAMDIHVDDCLCKSTMQEIRNEVTLTQTPPSTVSASFAKKRSAGSMIANNSKKSKKMSGLPIDAFFQKL